MDGEWVPHDLGSVCPCFVFPFYIPFLTALLYAPHPAGNPLSTIGSLPFHRWNCVVPFDGCMITEVKSLVIKPVVYFRHTFRILFPGRKAASCLSVSGSRREAGKTSREKERPPGLHKPGGLPWTPAGSLPGQAGCLPLAGIRHAAIYRWPADTQIRKKPAGPERSVRTGGAGVRCGGRSPPDQ